MAQGFGLGKLEACWSPLRSSFENSTAPRIIACSS